MAQQGGERLQQDDERSFDDDAQPNAQTQRDTWTGDPWTGHCLCGAVSYEVRGPLRDVLICHCEECRRWHGHFSASTAAAKDDLVLVEQRGLRWIDSPDSDAAARRGFCAECGSSLFWDPPRRETISIAAGTLDAAPGLRVVSHWFVSQVGDYYQLPDDGLPHHDRSGEGELP